MDFLDDSNLDNEDFDDYLKQVSLIELKSRVLKSCEDILKNELKNIQTNEIAEYWQGIFKQLQQVKMKQSINHKFSVPSDIGTGDLESDLELMANIKKMKITK